MIIYIELAKNMFHKSVFFSKSFCWLQIIKNKN